MGEKSTLALLKKKNIIQSSRICPKNARPVHQKIHQCSSLYVYVNRENYRIILLNATKIFQRTEHVFPLKKLQEN